MKIYRFTGLEILEFSYNKLTGEIPENIWNLEKLSDLRLKKNQITGEISKSIGKLTNLVYLNLSGNQLTGTVPEIITSLESLNWLFLKDNKITIKQSLKDQLKNKIFDEDLDKLKPTIHEQLERILENLPEGPVNPKEKKDLINTITHALTDGGQLDLSNNEIIISLPAESQYELLKTIFENGSKLTVLQLRNNNLKCKIPESIGNLSSLVFLSLVVNKLTGSIPDSIGNLSSLEALSLGNNQITGRIPESIGNLTKLQILYLAQNQMKDLVPESIWNLKELTSLILSDNKLTGTIPESIGELTGLKILELSNNELTGVIPSSIGKLTSLESLCLCQNQLTIGKSLKEQLLKKVENTDLDKLNIVPPTISEQLERILENLPEGPGTKEQKQEFIDTITNALTNGGELVLRENKLIQSLPPESQYELLKTIFENGSKLTVLDLYNNNLKCKIPESIGKLTNLEILNLGSNQIIGSIPESIGNLKELINLILSVNKLTGPIPGSIGNVEKLVSLDLRYNQITGVIPESIGDLKELINLYLHPNQLTIGHRLKEQLLKKLYFNDLKDLKTTPPTISEQLEGILEKLPEGPGTKEQKQEFIDTITNALTDGGQLDLNNNEIIKSLPAESQYELLKTIFENGSKLKSLELYGNNFKCEIPESIGKLTNLEILELSYNQIKGEIPESIGKLTSLKRLVLDHNQLTGEIPESIGQLISIERLNLRDNKLTGSIPESIGNLTSLESLYLSQNQLTGEIPGSIGELTGLKYLGLNFNQLTGTIPESIGNIKELKVLRLSYNQLTIGQSLKEQLLKKVENNDLDKINKLNSIMWQLHELSTIERIPHTIITIARDYTTEIIGLLSENPKTSLSVSANIFLLFILMHYYRQNRDLEGRNQQLENQNRELQVQNQQLVRELRLMQDVIAGNPKLNYRDVLREVLRRIQQAQIDDRRVSRHLIIEQCIPNDVINDFSCGVCLEEGNEIPMIVQSCLRHLMCEPCHQKIVQLDEISLEDVRFVVQGQA